MAALFPVTLKRALKSLTFAFLHFVAPLSTTVFSCVLPDVTGTYSQQSSEPFSGVSKLSATHISNE